MFVFLFCLILGVLGDSVIEAEFKRVTCGSSIKLTHSPTQYKLHSHGVAYGSGSGQQSVTGFEKSNDPNSLWQVVAGYNENACPRGQPVNCGQIIRLIHLNTKKHLHSHNHVSPLSSQQEVSGYEFADLQNNWIVRCVKKSGGFWDREAIVRLEHLVTKKFLTASLKFQYRHPIPGQLEVSAVGRQGESEEWAVQEGIFFAATI